jgi:hypothetical protein
MFTDDPTGRNDRELTTADGDAVRNRELWTVTQVHADGSLTVRRTNRHAVAVLPAEYVSEHVRLGYAATEHGNGTDTRCERTLLATSAPATPSTPRLPR